MAKFCANGHQMEDSWDQCPYCQPTGYQRGGVAAGGGAKKTVLETEVAREAGAAGGGRKTVLISEKRKPPVLGWLVAMSGDQKGEDFRVREGKNLLGSGLEAQVVLRDTTVSGQHASLRYDDGKFFLTDLDSSNGTYINEKKISKEELKDNDVVRVGEVTLKFKAL
ncbi:MAG TPA: FHA domain-containing protein [Terriglobia bacterium]|nr:FHA domain-containing protein [Terriglobia bacterium]